MLNLPPVAGRAQKLTLTVGEKGHYQLEGDNVTLQGVVGQPLSAANIAITIAAIQAKPGTQFTITQLSELEAIDALQLRFSVSERSKDSGMLGLTITGKIPMRWRACLTASPITIYNRTWLARRRRMRKACNF